jgi:alkylation response protein AidB-like acyl-CoA dehydrogenase
MTTTPASAGVSAEDRADLLRTTRAWLAAHGGAAPPAFDRGQRRGTLAEVAALGWLGVGAAEELDGAGGGWGDHVALLQLVATRFVGAPVLSTAGLALPLLVATERGYDAARRVVAGEATATVALGTWTATGLRPEATWDGRVLEGRVLAVPDAIDADHVVVAARATSTADEVVLALVATAAEGVTVTPVSAIDHSAPAADLDLAGAEALLLGRAADLGDALDRAILSLAATELGGAERCLELTLEHVGTREQFGKVIGAFQAVAHQCAEMLVHVESARAAVESAAHALDAGSPDAAAAVSTARATSQRAYAFCADTGLHLHGGIGFTWEHEPHWHLRRSWSLRSLLGSAEDHYERIGLSILEEGA